MIIFHNLSTQLICIFFPFLALESIIIVGLGHNKLEKRSNATTHFGFCGNPGTSLARIASRGICGRVPVDISGGNGSIDSSKIRSQSA